MDDQYKKMLDSDNFTSRQRTFQEHQRTIEKIYRNYPKLKQLDTKISDLQKEYANQLAQKLKGNKNIDVQLLNNQLLILIDEKDKFLEENKIPKSYQEPIWKCSKCEDRGKVYTEEGVMPCDCQTDTSLILRRRQAGLSLKIRDASFKDLNFDIYPDQNSKKNAIEVYDWTYKYLKELVKCHQSGQPFQDGIFIDGETGSGKTHLLGCIANYLIENNVDVTYIVYADLLDRIRETFNSDNTETESSIMRRINSVSVLLIDDLGMEKNTEFAQKYLGQIIDHRYRNMLPTIITSNFTLPELKDRSKDDLYGERVVWRLMETSNLIHVTGNLRNST